MRFVHSSYRKVLGLVLAEGVRAKSDWLLVCLIGDFFFSSYFAFCFSFWVQMGKTIFILDS